MKFHTAFAISLLLFLSFADYGNSCDYGRTLSCCGTHVNFIINSYKTNNLYITINPTKRARDICCHMKHVERCLLVETDCRPFYNTFVNNLYHNLQRHDVDCGYYKQHYCPGLQLAAIPKVKVNFLGIGPKPQRPLIKYPEEATIVVNAITDTMKTALENATQEQPTTIYADTVTEPGLVLEQLETTPIPELSFGEETLTDCEYDGTTPMPDTMDSISIQGPTVGSVDTSVLERPVKCQKSRVPVASVSALKPVIPKPLPKPQRPVKNCANEDDGKTTAEKPTKDLKLNEVTDKSAKEPKNPEPREAGCGKKGEKNAGSIEPVSTAEPASNEENPSEPESSPSPVESGEQNPNEKVSPNVESGEENPASPANTESGEQGPTKAGSGEQGPSKAGSGEQGPTKAGSGEQGPTNTESGEQGPTKAGSGEQGPTNTESGEQGPTKAGSGEQGPTNTESGEQGLTKAASGEKGPKNTESGEQEPTKKESGEQNPANNESGEQTPTKAGSGEQGRTPADDTSAEENPKTAKSGENTQPATESGEETPSTACSKAKTETNSAEEENGENGISSSVPKESNKPCKDPKPAAPSGKVETKPVDSEAEISPEPAPKPAPKPIEKYISPEEKQRACCLGTYLKPCTTINSKCYQLYLALHSFLAKYDCLKCVNLEVVHDGCHQRPITTPPPPKPAADSSEEDIIIFSVPVSIPKNVFRPVLQPMPKIKVPRHPQNPIKAQSGRQAARNRPSNRKPAKKPDSSEEKENED